MHSYSNSKGMTLIEIMVVLLISSILMFICGTLIIQSMGYFNKTSDANIDKFTTDKVVEHVRSTLIYASNVQIADKEPAGKNWHSISISNKHTLLVDGEEQFAESFYKQRELSLSALRYKDDYRIDFEYAWIDDTKILYQRSETLELINMKNRTIKSERTVLTQISDTMKIYYQVEGYSYRNDPIEPEIPEVLPVGSTVEYEVSCMDKDVTAPQANGNNKGVWEKNKIYYKGNFVYYPNSEGSLYRLTGDHDGTSTEPNKASAWKKIDKNFVAETIYQRGDIVIFNKEYYQVIAQAGSGAHKPGPTTWAVWKGPKDTVEELMKLPEIIVPDYMVCKKTP